INSYFVSTDLPMTIRRRARKAQVSNPVRLAIQIKSPLLLRSYHFCDWNPGMGFNLSGGIVRAAHVLSLAVAEGYGRSSGHRTLPVRHTVAFSLCCNGKMID